MPIKIVEENEKGEKNENDSDIEGVEGNNNYKNRKKYSFNIQENMKKKKKY